MGSEKVTKGPNPTTHYFLLNTNNYQPHNAGTDRQPQSTDNAGPDRLPTEFIWVFTLEPPPAAVDLFFCPAGSRLKCNNLG